MMKYKELENLITEVLAEADMERLIEIGSPIDEYKPEAETIAKFITEYLDVITEDVIAKVCAECFNCYFLPIYVKEDFELVAKCIFKNMKENIEN